MRYYIIISMLCCTFLAKAQDPTYSQFHAAPLQLNPALAGIVAAPTIAINYRNQWPNIPNAYNTFSASYGQYFPRLNSGIGFRAAGDIAGNGIYSSIRVGLFYAYDIRFKDNFFIRIGLEGSVVNKRLNWDRLIFFDQIDVVTGPTLPTNEAQGAVSQTYFDLSPGFLINTKYFWAGIAVKHITAPKESFVGGTQDGSDQLPVALSFHAGSEISLNRNNKIKNKAFLSPNALFLKQQQFHQLNIGAYLRYGIILGGIWFRHTFTNSDAVIFMVGVQKGFFKVAYSFDWTVSELGMQTGGAHEISLYFNFENKNTSYQNRYNDCLNLFR